MYTALDGPYQFVKWPSKESTSTESINVRHQHHGLTCACNRNEHPGERHSPTPILTHMAIQSAAQPRMDAGYPSLCVVYVRVRIGAGLALGAPLLIVPLGW